MFSCLSLPVCLIPEIVLRKKIMFEFTIKNKMKFVIYDSLITVTYLSVNNYYGINDCNTIYMSL